MKRTIAYIRVHDSKDRVSEQIQKNLINKYCESMGILCDAFYSDVGIQRRKTSDLWRANCLGFASRRGMVMYPEWEKMLLEVQNGNIKVILVDSRTRLQGNTTLSKVFNDTCLEHNVEVVEVSADVPPNSDVMPRVAIYHFTEISNKRSSIVIRDIDQLYRFTSHHGWEVNHTYLDLSLKLSERKEFSQLLKNLDRYDILIVKSLYHINLNMMTFFSSIQTIVQNGVRIISMEEGELNMFSYHDWKERRLSVAIYDRHRSLSEQEYSEIIQERLRIFVECKTKGWVISKIYIDEMGNREQCNLQRMVKESEQYDMVLVDTFGKIGDRVNLLYKFKNKIEKPIFSLQEGGIC